MRSHLGRRARAAPRIPLTLLRAGKELPLNLPLPDGWLSRSDISKRVGTWPMRAMAFGGMSLEDLDGAARTSLGLSKEGMALRIKQVGQFGPHAAAKKAGFLAGDILLQVDQLKDRVTESALIGHLLQTHRPGEKLPAHLLRNGKRLDLLLPQP